MGGVVERRKARARCPRYARAGRPRHDVGGPVARRAAGLFEKIGMGHMVEKVEGWIEGN